MDPDLSALDDALDEYGADGYLIDADGDDSDQRYVSGFTAPDPFVTLYDGGVHLLVSSLEYGRARGESRADSVSRLGDFGYQNKTEEYGRDEAARRVLVEFLDARDVGAVIAPERFPLGTADGLREGGVEVTVEREGVVETVRAVKEGEEIEQIHTAQRANEAAMARAEDLLREADVDGDGQLVHGGGVLTSERVRRAIEMELLEHDHALDETIVACGADAADPHDRGSGPLRAGETIIVDVFPRGKESGYHADMTRTFVKGEPADAVEEWYDLTLEAQEAALEAIEAGVSGAAVHDAVCDVYEAAGEPTLRSDEATETGFIHGTGHGIGLDVHEPPRLAPGGEKLEAGMVVTVEPGLYDPGVGGVRIEDFVVVRENGCENPVDYRKNLTIE